MYSGEGEVQTRRTEPFLVAHRSAALRTADFMWSKFGSSITVLYSTSDIGRVLWAQDAVQHCLSTPNFDFSWYSNLDSRWRLTLKWSPHISASRSRRFPVSLGLAIRDQKTRGGEKVQSDRRITKHM
ncbi:uncharacterized protein UTRI_01857 [Ustilago trichophora]|uniref:Uncharacterized protein n=1 Tax=Ustilago trichophora TaxID=86804 RepID=A0A5C3E190_9BASI|nr:uncharacterized protein UTRI_01857 [Ustilago trichophora]